MPPALSTEQKAINEIARLLGSLVLLKDGTEPEGVVHVCKKIEQVCKETRFAVTIKPIIDDVEDSEL